MKVLIIGGTGFISGAIASHATAAGHEVTLFNRNARNSAAPYKTIVGDVADLATVHADEVRQGGFDVVVHCIATTKQHGADLAAVFDRKKMPGGRAPHIIALSSIDCYQAFWDMQAGMNPAKPVDERAALCRTRHYWKHMPGREKYDKNLMTQELMRANNSGALNATVFRIPLVYGPHDHQFAHRHGLIIRHLLEGRTTLTMSASEQQDVLPYTYVDNIAAAIVHGFGHTKAYGGIYNLADSTHMPRSVWAASFAAVAGQPLALRASTATTMRAPHVLMIDASRYQRDTGFVPPVDITTAVCLTYAWAKANPASLAQVHMPAAPRKKTPPNRRR